jgi:hypothetical protein
LTFTDGVPAAAWRHVGARDGFEIVFIRHARRGWRLDGHTVGVDAGVPWALRYRIAVDHRWRTRAADVIATADGVARRTSLRRDASAGWLVDGSSAPHLDGCVDVDLEVSVCTNTIAVRRMQLRPGEASDAPAAYVRADGHTVERLDQTYRRCDDDAPVNRYDYAASRFDFNCCLEYDDAGLILNYPGLATRVPLSEFSR